MPVDVELAPGAEDNGLAIMLSDLVRQNLEAKPHKKSDFDALAGTVAIVADDADVVLTMRFEAGGKMRIFDGIEGIPDVTIRGPADAILAMSNMPLATRARPSHPAPGRPPGAQDDARAVQPDPVGEAAQLRGALPPAPRAPPHQGSERQRVAP